MVQNIDRFLPTVMCPKCAREVHKDNYCSFCGSSLQDSHGLYDAPSVGLEFADSFLDEEKVLVNKKFSMLVSDPIDQMSSAWVVATIEGDKFSIVITETRQLLRKQQAHVHWLVNVIVGVILTVFGCTSGNQEYEFFKNRKS